MQRNRHFRRGWRGPWREEEARFGDERGDWNPSRGRWPHTPHEGGFGEGRFGGEDFRSQGGREAGQPAFTRGGYPGYGAGDAGWGGGYPGYGEPDFGRGRNFHRARQGSYGEGGFEREDEERHRFDDDYWHWRNEQLRKFDEDYEAWRNERRQKFSEEFDKWRASRPQRSEGSRATTQADMKNK